MFAMLLLTRLSVLASFWGFEGERAGSFGKVWEAELPSFGKVAYAAAVEASIDAFEKSSGKRLEPGPVGRAGIKIYTNSGPGLDTPQALVLGVIQALEKRGFSRDSLMIVDASTSNLRASHFIPPLSAQESDSKFEGVPVVGLDSKRLYDPQWFYESAVPQEFSTPLGKELLKPLMDVNDPEARKSWLNAAFLLKVDFWINLPMVTDHPALGMNGALVNGTLWNVGNRNRFFSSPVNAPVAVAEIAAIPEQQDTWALNILTLERYQFIGGPSFNSLYTRTETKLWTSADFIALDALALNRMNRARVSRGFSPLGMLVPSLIYAIDLGLGYGLSEQIKLIPVSPETEKLKGTEEN